MADDGNAISWYFKRGIGSIFTIPLFLFLVASTLFFVFQGGVQVLAAVRLLYLIFGWVACVGIFFLIPFILMIFFSAAFFSLCSIVAAPSASSSAKTTTGKIGMFLVSVVSLQLIANLITIGVGWGVGKVADYNPAAAAKVGVYGSNVP